MNHHCTDSELRQLWFGGLPAPADDRTRRHLSRCEQCLSRLLEIDGHGAGVELPWARVDPRDEHHPAALSR
jgi:hypothetical protein